MNIKKNTKSEGTSVGPKYFFTSDTHFGHGNIIKYSSRPFLAEKDKDELKKTGAWQSEVLQWAPNHNSKWKMTDEAVHMMNDVLIDEINRTVGENDVLWHLGDFAFAGKYDYYSKCKYYRDRIKCNNVNLIWGNHDNRQIRDLFNETYDLKMIHLPNQSTGIVLCHYSMAIWDGSHRNNMHFYGHSHSEAETWMDSIMPSRRSLDVGVDNAAKLLGKYRPFSMDEINDRLSHRVGFSFDHHSNEHCNKAN